jgi:hypothetical protein
VFWWEKNQNKEKLRLKGLPKLKLNFTRVEVCNYVLVKVFKIVFSYMGSLNNKI